jgi:hypothetical protein
MRAARRWLGEGDDLQTVLARLRAAGLGVIPCIRVVREVLEVSLGHAKALVHFSPAFVDQRAANEALHGNWHWLGMMTSADGTGGRRGFHRSWRTWRRRR